METEQDICNRRMQDFIRRLHDTTGQNELAIYNETDDVIAVEASQGGQEDIDPDQIRRYAVVAFFEHERHEGIRDNLSFAVGFADNIQGCLQDLASLLDYSPDVLETEIWDLDTGRSVFYTRATTFTIDGLSITV